MTFSRAKPGGWQTGERLTSSQANHIDGALPDAIDGGAGGEYNPTNPLIIGGAGLRVGVPTDNSSPVRKQDLDDDISELQSTKVTAGSARYTVSGSGLSGNTRATLAQEFADTGFVLVGGNRITVPKIGRYMVTLNVRLTGSDASNPLAIGAGFTVNGSLVLQTWTRRFSATAGDSLSVTCAGIISITNIAEEIDVRPFGSGDFAVVGSSFENRFSIMSCGS